MTNESESHRAFLLAWNPAKSIPDYLTTDAHLRKEGRPDEESWDVCTRTIRPGDRVFLMRLAVEPKGIVASGYVTSEPWEGEDWEGDPRKRRLNVTVAWDTALYPDVAPPLGTDALCSRAFPQQLWTPQRSGISIRFEALGHLEKEWRGHITSLDLPRVHGGPSTP